MTGIELAAVVIVAVWLAVLSLVVILLVRQLGLVTVRLDANTFSLDKDGPEVGSLIPPEILQKVPRLGQGGLAYVLTLGATCTPCRELVSNLRGAQFDEDMIALLGGRPEVADSVAEMLPPSFSVVRDPVAHETATALSIQSTPFVIEVQDGVVTGRAYVRDRGELLSLMEARTMSDAPIIAADRKEEVETVG